MYAARCVLGTELVETMFCLLVEESVRYARYITIHGAKYKTLRGIGFFEVDGRSSVCVARF